MTIFLLQLQRINRYSNHITYSCLKQIYTISKIVHSDEVLNDEEKIFKKHQDHIYYSEYIGKNRVNPNHTKRVIAKYQKQTKNLSCSENPLPLSLKYLGYGPVQQKSEQPEDIHNNLSLQSTIHFPYKDTTSIKTESELPEVKELSATQEVDLEIKTRLELLNKSKNHLDWMYDYENFPLAENSLKEQQSDDTAVENVNYGTPNPNIPISNVPCGGCGALLHCKDSSIPGYIPSEIFTSYKLRGGIKLEGTHCQRCHFLKHYNVALQVQVSPDDYPKVLTSIAQKKKALVILLVDLLDFPCSIWPGIPDLIGTHRPIVVVGNKVDLLPDDGKGYLRRIQANLSNSLRESGFGMTNILHTALISAKTGFGVEDLITSLHSLWQYRGDVYIVGCTNVGKSTLFNILLQTDYCKHSAVDLIQRATTSPWPGTTLNLLKFPILRPTGWRLHVRHKRLESVRLLEKQENELRQRMYKKTGNLKYATMISHIDRSFNDEEPVDDEASDIYAVRGKATSLGQKPVGLNMKDKRFMLSKWCYDTPGVIQPEQITNHFITDELVKVFPSTIIKPRTFSLQPGCTLFIAGIARLDFREGSGDCRFTVFASHQLPITVCKTTHAHEIYNDLLRTGAFQVPINNEDRLKFWPELEASKYFRVTGIDRDISCADLVLSNAGWIAITPDSGETCVIQGWTPERRGIYLRDCLLPNVVRHRGKKLNRSVAYSN